jgi:hypothetical protein
MEIRMLRGPAPSALLLVLLLSVPTAGQSPSGADAAEADSIAALARERFGSLTPADEQLMASVAAGRPADYSGSDPPVAVRADRISWLCSAPEVAPLVGHRGVTIRGAEIAGRIDLRYASIPFPVSLEDVSCPGGILLRDARLPALYLPGSRFGLVNAQGLRVAGDVVLGRRFDATGTVSLRNARIGGDLNCDGGRFVNKLRYALDAEGSRVDGSVLMSKGFHADGEVRLVGATVGGAVVCHRATLAGRGSYALRADGISVAQNLVLGPAINVSGKVSLFGASINGYFHCSGVTSPVQLRLDLRAARAGGLWDDPGSWPAAGWLEMNGFVFDYLVGNAPTDARSRIDWLRRQPQHRFHPQPYENLARALRNAGRRSDARRVLVAKGRDHARLGSMSLPERAWQYLLGATIGYGYRPWQALWWMASVVGVGAALFGTAYRADLMARTDTRAVRRRRRREEGMAPGEAFAFNPVMYSLDAFLPLVDLHQDRYWLPKAEGKVSIPVVRRFSLEFGARVLWVYLWFEIVAGWVLTPLLLAGLLGIARL